MPNNPVQVILNTKDYFITPDPKRRDVPKDFYAGKDKEFAQHRSKLLRQVGSIGGRIQQSGASAGAVVKVTLQKEAWAKTHRPQQALFPPAKRPCVGASKLGELFYFVTAQDVNEVSAEIAAAESETRIKVRKSGKRVPTPTFRRSEVGAIESIELPQASEKRGFSVDTAIGWLRDPRTAGAYFVELFSLPPRFLPGILADYLDGITRQITQEATKRRLALETFRVDITGNNEDRRTGVVGVRLITQGNRGVNTSAEDHTALLTLLESNPYVRRIMLPPIVVAARMQMSAVDYNGSVAVPKKQEGQAYPRIGIIDGGIGSYYDDWIVGDHPVVAPAHRQTDHGSFIGGLVVGGQKLNGNDVCAEVDGCELFDIGILPDPDQPSAFEAYYPNGVRDFVREVDAGVEVARSNGFRVFNLSLNLHSPVEGEGCGVVANLLDQIADKHDVMFVISAGNLDPADCRSEWSVDPRLALQYLAARTAPDTLLQPAESSRSISVGALNPPGCAGRIVGAPTAYTRRGPGLRVGVKPDVGQYGGALPGTGVSSGIKSWLGENQVVEGYGTSYATPLVAKPIAVLDSRVMSPMTREMLIALLVHGCKLPAALQAEELADIARQFAGFGRPSSCDEMLQTGDHAITLVFADILQAKRELAFEFAWPKSLVKAGGKCTGQVQMTLVYRPPLNHAWGSEFVRVNIDAYLRQEHKGKFTGRLSQAFLPEQTDEGHFEYELIEHGLKWWPVKVYRGRFPRGLGSSSNWKLCVESLLRANEDFPADGVPFALVLTISDIQKAAPVFNDLRLHLRSQNVQMSNIQTRPQVRIQP